MEERQHAIILINVNICHKFLNVDLNYLYALLHLTLQEQVNV